MIRKIVLPGTEVGDAKSKLPGKGVFKEGDKIYASRLGILSEKGKYINVIPLSGVYDPNVGDNVIGVIQEVFKNAWIVDINAPYPAFLNLENVPWRVDYGETSKYLKVGDVIIATIAAIDEAKNIDISMKCKACRKIEDGIIIEIQPSKVPRVIGKSGSMLATLKKYTQCWIFVGQNGRIWIKGEDEKVNLLIKAIRKIEKEAHTFGLTQRIIKMLGG
ncbi:MAG TPA: S1 RNA-binding domain-containing protein [Thermoplasmatales archaeon]|nr:S1 RNA-binding domain-containing protein [Thermoplasmatales archaeon]